MVEQERSELDEIVARINASLESRDITAVSKAIGEAIKQHNLSDVAKKTGLHRPSIYRAFGGKQSPNFSTVLSVLDAIGLQLKVKKSRGKR